MNKRKELVKELIKEFELKDTNDISSMFRELMGDTIQEMLNSELDEGKRQIEPILKEPFILR